VSAAIAVIVANWNGLEYLRTCIPAVLAQDYPHQLVVVDNGSTDGSVDWLHSEFPQVRLICNEANDGFARANNQGIQATTGEYVATLNNDAHPEGGWLAALADTMERDEQVGMVASQVRFAHRPDLIDSAGIEVDVLGVAWHRHFGQPAARESQEIGEVFGPCAAAALYRRAMLDAIGLFDARYFAYYEDVELAWRARRAGWRCLYAPGAKALHQHSATGRQGSPFKVYHLNRNRVWTLIRHYPARRLIFWWPFILLRDTASWAWPLLSGRSEALQGHVDALRQWRQMWVDRRRMASWQHDVPLSPPRLRASPIPAALR
jgi:GT2 family glycosyltransferase